MPSRKEERRPQSAREGRRPQTARASQESRGSAGYPPSDVGSRRSYESRRSDGGSQPSYQSRRSDEFSGAMSSRGSRRSAEYEAQSARGSERSKMSGVSRASYDDGLGSRYSDGGSQASASYSQASYNTSKASEFFDVVGTPRPHMLGFTFKKRAENGFGRTVYGGFTLREAPPPLKNPDYSLAYRGQHPDTRFFAEPNQPGPGFRRTANGNFWRR